MLPPSQSTLPLEHTVREKFWENYPLEALNKSEWEALCDGCGLCCLHKLEDEDTGEVVYTKVACTLLNTKTGKCGNYVKRLNYVPDCLQLTPELTKKLQWLPNTCAYKRLGNGKKLPSWHPLLSKKFSSVVRAGVSVAGRCITETDVVDDDWQEYVITWVDF